MAVIAQEHELVQPSPFEDRIDDKDKKKQAWAVLTDGDEMNKRGLTVQEAGGQHVDGRSTFEEWSSGCMRNELEGDAMQVIVEGVVKRKNKRIYENGSELGNENPSKR
jgi:hypothetical protein